MGTPAVKITIPIEREVGPKKEIEVEDYLGRVDLEIRHVGIEHFSVSLTTKEARAVAVALKHLADEIDREQAAQ